MHDQHIVQESRDLLIAKQHVTRAIELEGVISVGAVQQGVELWHLFQMKAHLLYGFDNWADWLMDTFGIVYQSGLRRIKAAEWFTELGIPLDELYPHSHLLLAKMRPYATSVKVARLILKRMKDGITEKGLLEEFGGIAEHPERAPVSIRVVRCPHCTRSFEVES